MQEALESLTTIRLFLTSSFNWALPSFLLSYVEIKFVTECEQQSGCSCGFLPFASLIVFSSEYFLIVSFNDAYKSLIKALYRNFS